MKKGTMHKTSNSSLKPFQQFLFAVTLSLLLSPIIGNTVASNTDDAGVKYMILNHDTGADTPRSWKEVSKEEDLAADKSNPMLQEFEKRTEENSRSLLPLLWTLQNQFADLNKAIHTWPQDTATIEKKAKSATDTLSQLLIKDALGQASCWSIFPAETRQAASSEFGPRFAYANPHSLDHIPERGSSSLVLTPEQKQKLKEINQKYRQAKVTEKAEKAYRDLSETIITNPTDEATITAKARIMANLIGEAVLKTTFYRAASFAVFTPEQLKDITLTFQQSAKYVEPEALCERRCKDPINSPV